LFGNLNDMCEFTMKINPLYVRRLCKIYIYVLMGRASNSYPSRSKRNKNLANLPVDAGSLALALTPPFPTMGSSLD
jgi:hypothetical protein